MTRVSLAVLVVALAGCDAILGIETLERTPPTQTHASEECRVCLEQSCAEQQRSCAADAGCARHQRCLALCAPNDARCRLACETASPITVSTGAFPPLDRCVRASCAEQCLGLASLATAFGDSCSCLDAACREMTIACLRSGVASGAEPGGCEHSLMCVAANGITPSNAQECSEAWRSTTDDLNRLRNCWAGTTGCSSCPVAGGANYACVGKYRWAPPQAPEVKISIHVTTFDAKQTPIARAKVRACSFESCERCEDATPVDEDLTNENGDVTLQLPASFGGFAGCFDIRADGYAPTLFSLGRSAARDLSVPMFLVPTLVFSALPAGMGTTPLDGRGTVLTLSADCFHALAPGVKVDLLQSDMFTKRGYNIGNGIDTSPEAKTGRSGVTIFVNAPTGYIDLRSSYNDASVGQLRFMSRAGIISVAVLYPRIAD